MTHINDSYSTNKVYGIIFILDISMEPYAYPRQACFIIFRTNFRFRSILLSAGVPRLLSYGVGITLKTLVENSGKLLT